MKFFFFALLLMGAGAVSGQTTINLTEDLVLTETLVISENTVMEGNGFNLRCDGCSPAIRVSNGADLQLNDVRMPRGYGSFITVDGPDCSASWTSPLMSGSINWNPADRD